MKDYLSLYESQKTVEYFGLILTIPDVACWLATDSDGSVYLYTDPPVRCGSSWDEHSDSDISVFICKVNLNDIDWTTTLKEIK
jgi:hypothetical protein